MLQLKDPLPEPTSNFGWLLPAGYGQTVGTFESRLIAPAQGGTEFTARRSDSVSGIASSTGSSGRE